MDSGLNDLRIRKFSQSIACPAHSVAVGVRADTNFFATRSRYPLPSRTVAWHGSPVLSGTTRDSAATIYVLVRGYYPLLRHAGIHPDTRTILAYRLRKISHARSSTLHWYCRIDYSNAWLCWVLMALWCVRGSFRRCRHWGWQRFWYLSISHVIRGQRRHLPNREV